MEPAKKTITTNGAMMSMPMMIDRRLRMFLGFCTIQTLLNTFSTESIIQITTEMKNRELMSPSALL